MFYQDIQRPGSGLKKGGAAEFSDFEVFGYPVETLFLVFFFFNIYFIMFDLASQTIQILGNFKAKVRKILSELRSGIQTTVTVLISLLELLMSFRTSFPVHIA